MNQEDRKTDRQTDRQTGRSRTVSKRWERWFETKAKPGGEDSEPKRQTDRQTDGRALDATPTDGKVVCHEDGETDCE